MSQDKVHFDPRVVRQLAKILNETDLNEIEYESEGSRIKVARSRPEVHVTAGQPHPSAVGTNHPSSLPSSPVEDKAGEKMEAPTPIDHASHPGVVKSPMVGLCYMAPEPDAHPFVSVGDTIKEGQTLCIIEAMKVMNPIRAAKSGKVRQILVGNASPVEFDEPLFIVE